MKFRSREIFLEYDKRYGLRRIYFPAVRWARGARRDGEFFLNSMGVDETGLFVSQSDAVTGEYPRSERKGPRRNSHILGMHVHTTPSAESYSSGDRRFGLYSGATFSGVFHPRAGTVGSKDRSGDDLKVQDSRLLC